MKSKIIHKQIKKTIVANFLGLGDLIEKMNLCGKKGEGKKEWKKVTCLICKKLKQEK